MQENVVQQRKNIPELLCYEEKLACKIVGVQSKLFAHTSKGYQCFQSDRHGISAIADVLSFQFHNIDENDWNRRFSVTIEVAGKQYNRRFKLIECYCGS